MNLQENIQRIHEIMGVLMEDDKKYLYHGTSYDNAINIIDNGFNENTYWGDKSTAEQYAYSYDNPVLIKVEMNQIYDLLEPNYTLISYYEENMEDDDEYKDIIDLWGESDGTIEDSLNIFDSVILPPTYLQLSKENIMNLQENIQRIHEIMGGVITEDRKEMFIKNMIDDIGIENTIKMVGDYHEVEPFLKLIDKINYIKEKVGILDNYSDEGIALYELNEEPIYYTEEDGELHQIEYLYVNKVMVDVYGDGNGIHMDEYTIPYESLSVDIIEELFDMLLDK